MAAWSVQRRTGVLGLIASVILIAEIPLYFMYSGAPPTWNVLTRVLLGVCGCALLLVFHVGLRQVVRIANPGYEWTATVMLVAGLMWLMFSLVALSMEAGATIVATRPIDPTIEGALAPGQFLMQGPIGRMMTALFLFAAGFAIVRIGFVPTWVGKLAFMVALVNIAFVPSLYFGSNPAYFYSAVGWGTTASAPGLAICWILTVSGVMVWRARKKGIHTP